ncbi:hypothetical protein A2160_02290 [Candidatus Beckwithbacteria bacterium RBG_13_42_9]|uniref:DUF4012 domain-containing protein n=1 Tax=Candidatus Beckwithbacteria bacterium RBG_13_42_9 TaxID=1797457 RepID=A0A1F5E7F4_9BACT|nr:MAG: hypothetical protein A2160_02290 [Candidatus Beckwithbacteria bacterium RBG_13_42_9]
MTEGFDKINLPAEAIAEDHTVPNASRFSSVGDKPPKLSPSVKWLKWIGLGLAGLILLLVILLIPVFIVAGPLMISAQKTYASAQAAYTAAKNQDLLTADEKLKETHQGLQETQNQYEKLKWTNFVPGMHWYYQDGEHGLKAALASLEAAQILIGAITPYADVLGFKGQGSFMGGTAEDRIVKMVQTLDKVTPEIDKVAEKITVAEDNMSKINPSRYPVAIKGKPVRENIVQAQELIHGANLAVTDAKPVLSILPEALGYPTGKRYLVIFQNDGELRPTGGFMTAFAVLNVDVGRIKAEKSDDIYGLDRKFGAGLPAPDPIKKYLPLVNTWHLRDMNLSPDYKVSMMTFMENYDKLSGEYKVDGVITLDTEVLKRFVQVLGGIDIPDYGKFTIDNDPRCNIPQIICELEFIVDKPLATMVSNRKSAILGPMMQQILTKAMSSGKNQWGQIFTTGIQLLQEKHILMYFNKDDLQKAAESFSVAGRIKEYDGDYFHINDTNFGGAKSNLYVTQDVEQEIDVATDGTVTKKVTLIYTHPEAADNCNLETGGLCSSGILRDWFRVYVPKGAKLKEALGSEVKVEAKEDLGKTEFEGFFTLRPQSKTKVILTYELPNKLAAGQPYKLLIQKQPGTKENKYKITFGSQVKEFNLDQDKELTFSRE